MKRFDFRGHFVIRLTLVNSSICGVLFLALPPTASQTLANPGNAHVVARGSEFYRQHCASCHGANLEGQPNWRKRKRNGRMPAPPHDATGHTWHHRDEQLFKITKYGTEAIVGDFYKSDMRGFQNVLTDDEICAVITFIKSTWPERIRKRHDRMNGRQAQ